MHMYVRFLAFRDRTQLKAYDANNRVLVAVTTPWRQAKFVVRPHYKESILCAQGQERRHKEENVNRINSALVYLYGLSFCLERPRKPSR